jgi:hypothetical protein
MAKYGSPRLRHEIKDLAANEIVVAIRVFKRAGIQ